MKVEKRVISKLNKCYAVAPLSYEDGQGFLVAAEQKGPCYMFAEDGSLLDTIWTEPGGVMTMVQIPGKSGQFLAVHLFFSPDDSADAKIVIAAPKAKGEWEIRTLCKAPFVHRFGILRRAGVNYLFVCCLKTGSESDGDWRFPGACYGAELPGDLSPYNDDHLLRLKLIKDGLLKNHGYSLIERGGHDAALVGCECGTFVFEPPAVRGAQWEVSQISSVPSSDSVLMDFDGDGKPELGMISPFHGASLTIWHLDDCGNYVPQWKYRAPEKDTEMIHATCADIILGRPAWIVGWRKGTKDTIVITWDEEAGGYRTEYIDRDAGCANLYHFTDRRGRDIVVGANREKDEVAYYILSD